MDSYLARLRGVNVGQRTKVEMAALRELAGSPTTARNWRTVLKLGGLLQP